MARAVLGADPRLTVKLDLMLAECFGQLGSDDQRLDALRRVAEGDRSVGIRPHRARSGNRADPVISTRRSRLLSPLADRRPELRLDLVRLLIQKTSRQPRGQRDWREAERYLREAEKALPQAVESLTLLRVDLLAAQDRLDDARSLLSWALAKDPRNLRYRLDPRPADPATRQGSRGLADPRPGRRGPGTKPGHSTGSPGLLGPAGRRRGQGRGGEAGGESRRIPAADQPVFLDRLAAVEIRLGEPALAREHLRELAAAATGQRPGSHAACSMSPCRLADHACALEIVTKIRAIEGEQGTLWRFAQASYLLDEARRGETKDLSVSRALAAEIAAQRPAWWGSFVLLAEIAELEGQTDEAIKNYTQAIELGNTQPALARRLVGLLNQGETVRPDRSRDQNPFRPGLSAGDLMISTALNAIRQQDYDRGIALARQVFSERSTNFSDHLFLGQFYLAAHRPREAGKELRRAVELGPGVPITWVSYVQYLVLEKQIDQAKATVEAARKALPADRANLALAQCYAMLGETTEAEARIQAALGSSSLRPDHDSRRRRPVHQPGPV